MIAELPNAAYGCGQYGSVTAWLWSPRPVNVIPVPKTSALFGVGVTRVECMYLSNTTLFDGRGISSIYCIRYNYMFRRLTMAILGCT